MIGGMRLTLSMLLLVSLSLFAQEKEGKKKGPDAFATSPKNMKVLTQTGDDLRRIMQGFNRALGAENCQFCHVQGDFASDDKPQKVMARMMISMARDINSKFPDGKQHVTCYTCHRGSNAPATEPPPA
jgi:photosynthetic reaction center cytochrome c subunit